MYHSYKITCTLFLHSKPVVDEEAEKFKRYLANAMNYQPPVLENGPSSIDSPYVEGGLAPSNKMDGGLAPSKQETDNPWSKLVSKSEPKIVTCSKGAGLKSGPCTCPGGHGNSKAGSTQDKSKFQFLRKL